MPTHLPSVFITSNSGVFEIDTIDQKTPSIVSCDYQAVSHHSGHI